MSFVGSRQQHVSCGPGDTDGKRISEALSARYLYSCYWMRRSAASAKQEILSSAATQSLPGRNREHAHCSVHSGPSSDREAGQVVLNRSLRWEARLLYHALIVRLSPSGPQEPAARRAWWTTDCQAARPRCDAFALPVITVTWGGSVRTVSWIAIGMVPFMWTLLRLVEWLLGGEIWRYAAPYPYRRPTALQNETRLSY